MIEYLIRTDKTCVAILILLQCDWFRRLTENSICIDHLDVFHGLKSSSSTGTSSFDPKYALDQ